MANDDTPLIHSAVESYDGDLAPVKSSLLKQNDINVANSEGETPLHLAAQNESCFSEELIEFLLEHGADVNAVNANGDTPLHLAAQNNSPLLRHISQPVIASRSNDELTLQENDDDDVISEKSPRVKKPLSEQVDSDVRRGICSKVPSTIAASVKILLERGSDVNAGNSVGDTPLHFAARNKTWCFHFLRLFLKKSRDVNVSNSKGETPLHTAVRSERCNVALIKMLLDHGADVGKEDVTGKNAYQAYRHAVAEDNRRLDPMLEILLRSNVQQHMDSSLHVASLFHKVDSVDKLLSTGRAADVNDTDTFGYPPLFYALIAYADNHDKLADKSSTLKLLLDYDADINLEFARSNLPTKYIFLDDMSLLSLGMSGLVDCDHEEQKATFDIFQEHLAKLLALHEKQEERGVNVQMLSEFNVRFGGPLDMMVESFNANQRNLFVRSCDELKVMSESKVGESEVSFLDLLVASDKKRRSYAKNEEVMEAFHAGKDKFPIYHRMLDAKLAKGLKRRNELVECSADFLSRINIVCSFVYRISQNVCRRFMRRFK